MDPDKWLRDVNRYRNLNPLLGNRNYHHNSKWVDLRKENNKHNVLETRIELKTLNSEIQSLNK